MKTKISLCITHGGPFHADDVTTAALLNVLLNIDPYSIERRKPTDEELLDPTVMVFDTGRQFDDKLLNFDHHQPGFKECRPNDGTLYSSVGLFWKHLLEQSLLEEDTSGLDAEGLKQFHKLVDKMLVEPVDLVDNGLLVVGEQPLLTYSGTIKYLNPLMDMTDDYAFKSAFCKAVDLAAPVVRNIMARARLMLKTKQEVLASKVVNRTLVLERGDMPYAWAMRQRPDQKDLLFVVFPSGDQWLTRVIEKGSSSKAPRRALPAKWAGLEAEPLQKASGAKDAVFCARTRHVAGASSKEGALALSVAAQKPQR